MAQVIDEFVLAIGLDPAGFNAGRKQLDEEIGKSRQTLEHFGRQVETQGAKVADVFGFMKKGVAGVVAAFVGGEAASFIERVAMMDAHTSRLAQSINSTTRELSIWQNMVARVGGTAEDANSVFAALNDTFQNMAMGNVMPSPGFASLLSRAGVDWRHASPDVALQQIMGFLSGQPAQQQRFWLSQIPGMNENMMFLMLEGAKNMARFREEIEKVGVASRKSGQEARDLQEKTAALGTAWDNFARQLYPALTQILGFLSSVFSSKAGGLIASILGGIVTGGTVGSVVPGVGTGIGALGGGIAGAITYGLNSGGVAGPAVASPGTGSRGDRNNNPGNIKFGSFAAAQGATGADAGGFAVFPTWDAGAQAMANLLHSQYQGLTLAQIQARWVGNPDSGYLARMMAATGLRANDVPNLNDNAVVAAIIRGMMKGEGTHVMNRPPATTNNKTSSVHIGEINVSSNKADPADVADQIPAAVQRNYSMLAGINGGLV